MTKIQIANLILDLIKKKMLFNRCEYGADFSKCVQEQAIKRKLDPGNFKLIETSAFLCIAQMHYSICCIIFPFFFH